ADADSHGLADGGSAAGGRDQARDLSEPAHHARHDHGVFRVDHGAAGWVWKLFFAHPDWRAGYGVSCPEHAFVLDDVRGVYNDPGGVLRDRRSSLAWLDRLCTAECIAQFRPRRTTGRGFMDHQHRNFLHSVADGRAELHHDYPGPASQRHDHDAHAAD